MSAWVLVLTIWGSGSQSGRAIEHIPGFTSQAACMAAGDAWLKSAPDSPYNRTTILCMEQKK